MDTSVPQNTTPNAQRTMDFTATSNHTATTAKLPLAPKRTTYHLKYHIDDTISTLSAQLRQV